MFGIVVARHKDASAMIGEFLLSLLRGENGRFLWLAKVCAIFRVLWGEQDGRMFRGVDRDRSEI